MNDDGAERRATARIVRRKVSLHWSVLGPLGVGGLVLIAVLVYWMRHELEAQFRRHAEQRVDVVANAIEHAAETVARRGEFQRFVSAIGAERAVDDVLVVAGEPPRVVAATNRLRHDRLVDSLEPASLRRQIVHSLTESAVKREFITETDAVTCISRITLSPREASDAQHSQGVVLVRLNTQSDQTSLATLTLSLLSLTVGGLIAFVLYGVWLVERQVLRPLEMVARVVRERLKGNWRARTSIPQRNEIGALGAMLDDAFDKLDQQAAEIRKLALVASRTHNAVVLTDAQGVIEWVNDGFTRITEYTLEEARGIKPGRLLQGPKTSPEVIKEVRRRLALGEGFQFELINYSKTGREYWIAVEVQPIRNEQGEITNFMAIESDITERKRTEEELQRAAAAAEAANRAKSEFLANISHEVRTPITAVLGYAEILLDPRLSQLQRDTVLRSIQRNGEHLLQIINDILDLSKIEAGKMTFESLRCSPWQIIQEVRSALDGKAREKGLQFDVEPVGKLPTQIQTDPVRVRQILLNLVHNAIKFTEQGRIVVRVQTIRASHSGPPTVLRFDVEDEGIGFDSKHVEKLFEAFFQADASTTRKYGGTGLGLRISKFLAQALGGDILACHRRGGGSIFSLTLPITSGDGGELVSGETLRALAVAGGERPRPIVSRYSGSILLVEDNADIQRILSHILRQAGYSVTLASNGREALDVADADKFDLVLMDMQMPLLDGYGATRQLRQRGFTRPIVALTAHAMRGDQEKCLTAGCVAYLTKPVRAEELLAAVATHLKDAARLPSVNVTSSDSVPPASAPSGENAPDASTALTSLAGDGAVAMAPASGSTASSANPSDVRPTAVDPALEQLMADFRAALPARIAEMRTACAHGEHDQVARSAHQLAGSSGMYGLRAVGETASLLEQAARERQDPELLAELIEEIDQLASGKGESSDP